MFRLIIIVSGAILASLSADLFADVNMREGLWELTTSMEFKGLPPGSPAVPPSTETRCITKNELQNPRNVIPSDTGCEVRDIDASGTTVKWQFQCSDLHGTGETRYYGDRYEGGVTATHEGTPGLGDVIMHYSGRRIGDCK